MANHMFHTQMLGLEPNPVQLYAVLTIGSSGAPTLTRGKGFKSISRTSTGLYVLTLDSSYNALLGFDVTTKTSTGLPAAPQAALVTDASTSTGALTFQMSSATSSSTTTLVAADPTSGDVLFVTVNLTNSSAF